MTDEVRSSPAAVAAAFAAVPRRGFLPEEVAARHEEDRPLPIGHDQTNSQPWTVRTMLELLDVRPGHRVLDVGAGSGWTTALLAHLAGTSGIVTGVEIVPELVVLGGRNLARHGPPGADRRTRIVAADPGQLGWPEGAPYDRILVSAEASAVPLGLVDQLAPGGRLVVPVVDRMTVVDLDDAGRLCPWEAPGRYRFVPLVEPPS